MSLSALLCVNNDDISTWTTETMARVLAEGDSMLFKDFEQSSNTDNRRIL